MPLDAWAQTHTDRHTGTHLLRARCERAKEGRCTIRNGRWFGRINADDGREGPETLLEDPSSMGRGARWSGEGRGAGDGHRDTTSLRNTLCQALYPSRRTAAR